MRLKKEMQKVNIFLHPTRLAVAMHKEGCGFLHISAEAS
jgi:hypothetical protein